MSHKDQNSCCSSDKMIENTGKVTLGGNPVTIYGPMVKAGDTAPDFTAVDAKMGKVSLSDFAGKVVVLSVFPSIDTGVCATQTRTFNKLAVGLSDDVVVLGLSKDLPFALGRFCAAEGIDRVVTLSDYMCSEFGRKYGFLIKENHLLTRGIVVIDRHGKVVYVEYVPEVATEPNYDKALEAVRKAL